ncbi:VOC family protein [Viridibacillus sp. NPDC096237]|uniref:VOC family protein n=1 Tax=Viridibacillus sp. NPDC096237 TaxID=3390721 RepID=UPI003D01DE92
MSSEWSASMQVVQVRVARPTDQIQQLERFYCDGLGLNKIGAFTGRGYDGLPNATYHLEFTQHIDGSPCPAPSKDNLIVFYLPNQQQINAIIKRLGELGYNTVPPENPYWEKEGNTIEDPDGWRVVLMHTAGI